MRRLLPVLVPVLLLAAAPADARMRTLGSSLEAPATIAEAQGADTAYWPRAVPGRRFRAPRDGQVLAVRIKGVAVPSKQPGAPAPLNDVHVQTLRPAGGGRMRVELTSAFFELPVGGRANRITTFRPENLCIRRGGVVDLNVLGGFAPPFYPEGVPFRVFAKVQGAATARFTRDNGTNNGATIGPGVVRSGRELLLQYVLGTGRHMGGACRGWHAQN